MLKHVKRTLSGMLCLAMFMGVLSSCGGGNNNQSNSNPNTNSGASHSNNSSTSSLSGEYDLTQVNDRIYTLGHTGSPGSTNDFWAETFAGLVKEKSGGKMVIENYNSSQLGSDTSIAADVQAGAVDFQITSPAAIPTVVPESAIFDMPFLFDKVEDAREVLLNEDFFSTISDAFAKYDLKLFPFTDQGFRSITTNVEITGIDSFKGMALRTMNNQHHIAWFTALGVAATPLNTSEIYLALQQGMLNGQENPWSQCYDKGLYDVQKYITNSNHVLYVGCLYTGTKPWDPLGEVEQQILGDAATECVPIVQEHTDSYEYEMLDLLLEDYNMTFTDFDKIPGLRDTLREKTFDVAYQSISSAIGTEILNQFLITAGYEDQIP